MKSFTALLIVLVAAAISVSSGFAPVAFAPRTATTAVSMFGGGKKKEVKKPGGVDPDVFGGKGKRITVREDEDNAMWIEEDDKGRKPAKGK